MREIKFRCWIKGLKKMSNLIELYCDGGALAGDYEYPLDKDGIEVMQFSGLKDKSGVEIYEGDIVKWGHIEGFIELSGVRIAVVDMSNSCDGLTFDAFKPVSHRFKIGNFMYRHSIDKCMEIIGNIHQNPELLEQ